MFSKSDIVFTYTTKQAIEDGYLVHIPKKEALVYGFRFPLLISRKLWDFFEKGEKNPKGAFRHLETMLYVFAAKAKFSNESSLIFHTSVSRTVIEVRGHIRQFDFDDPSPAFFFTFSNED